MLTFDLNHVLHVWISLKDTFILSSRCMVDLFQPRQRKTILHLKILFISHKYTPFAFF